MSAFGISLVCGSLSWTGTKLVIVHCLKHTLAVHVAVRVGDGASHFKAQVSE